MDLYEEDEETRRMQVIWRNPVPPRTTGFRPCRLSLNMDATIYVAGSPDVEAFFELILGGNSEAASAGQECIYR